MEIVVENYLVLQVGGNVVVSLLEMMTHLVMRNVDVEGVVVVILVSVVEMILAMSVPHLVANRVFFGSC